MASTEDRIKQLVQENLQIGGRAVDLDVSAADSGVSSMDIVGFLRVVEEEFGVTIPPAEAAKFSNLRSLVDYLDSQAG